MPERAERRGEPPEEGSEGVKIPSWNQRDAGSNRRIRARLLCGRTTGG